MRVSFSMLDSFARGDIDRAVAPFVGTWVPPNEAMIEGSNLHREWQAETDRTKCLPEVFGGRPIRDALTEKQTKKAVKLNDWLELSGVLDVKYVEEVEGHKINIGVDYKRSKAKTASDFANSFQHKVYHVLYPELDQFHYRAYNPRKRKSSLAICHLTDRTLEDGVEWIITHASGLRAYLEQNNISLERKVTK